MPRLFTALEIPSPLAFSLSLLRGGLPGARWIDPENYHINLRFIGDIDQRTADEVGGALERVYRPSFDLALSGLDAFGGNKPHSIVACVTPSAALKELQGEHDHEGAERERVEREAGERRDERDGRDGRAQVAVDLILRPAERDRPF